MLRLRRPGEIRAGVALFDEEDCAHAGISRMRGRSRVIVVDSGDGRTGLLGRPS